MSPAVPAVSVGSVVPGDSLARADVLTLYDAVGWTAYTRSPETLLAGVAGSSRVVVARTASELVGLARVVSDGATVCYLQDVLVRPDHQRTGLGRRLVEAVLEPYHAVRQQVLLTDDDPAQAAFYASLGFAGLSDVADGRLRAFVRFAS